MIIGHRLRRPAARLGHRVRRARRLDAIRSWSTRTRRLRAPLQIAGPPQTFFVGADGAIVYRHAGPFSSTAEIRRCSSRHLGVAAMSAPGLGRPADRRPWPRPGASGRVDAVRPGVGRPAGRGADLDRRGRRRPGDLVRRAADHDAHPRRPDRLPRRRRGPGRRRSGRHRAARGVRGDRRRPRRASRCSGSLPPAHVEVSGFDVTAVVGWWHTRSPVGVGRPARGRLGARWSAWPS